MGLRGTRSGRGGGQKLVGNRAVDTQHGSGEEESCTSLHKGLLPPSKGFFSYITTHVLPCIVYVVNMLSCAVHIYSPLQVKNKPPDRDSKHVFILGPASLVANSIFFTLEPSDLEIQHSPASYKKQCRAELNLDPCE
jgi:hypothetical protein